MKENDKLYFDLLISKCSLSMQIVKELKEHKTLNHSDLSKILNKTKQNLSNCIRKIEPFGILFIRRIGKNVYYSLNFKGYEFFDYICNEAILADLVSNFETDPVYMPEGVSTQGGGK